MLLLLLLLFFLLPYILLLLSILMIILTIKQIDSNRLPFRRKQWEHSKGRVGLSSTKTASREWHSMFAVHFLLSNYTSRICTFSLFLLLCQECTLSSKYQLHQVIFGQTVKSVLETRIRTPNKNLIWKRSQMNSSQMFSRINSKKGQLLYSYTHIVFL